MLSAPPGAQCAIHPANPATGVCERCGNFMCADCTPNGEPRCPTCREKDATPEFPFDANSTFTELFNHVVEQFKRGLIERADYEDDVLTIHAVDGDVVYRLVTDQFGRLYPNTQLMERVERAHL